MDKLYRKLERIMRGKIVIIGVGDRLRGDDGAGSIVAERLKNRIRKENIKIIDAEISPENYLEKIVNFSPDLILFLDSMDFGHPAGEIEIFKSDNILFTGTSTHNTFKPLVEYLKNTTGAEIFLLGIQPKSFTLDTLSEEVEEGIKKIEKMLESILKEVEDGEKDKD